MRHGRGWKGRVEGASENMPTLPTWKATFSHEMKGKSTRIIEAFDTRSAIKAAVALTGSGHELRAFTLIQLDRRD